MVTNCSHNSLLLLWDNWTFYVNFRIQNSGQIFSLIYWIHITSVTFATLICEQTLAQTSSLNTQDSIEVGINLKRITLRSLNVLNIWKSVLVIVYLYFNFSIIERLKQRDIHTLPVLLQMSFKIYPKVPSFRFFNIIR